MVHISTQWDDDAKTVMRVTYQNGWTWDEMFLNFPIEEAMLNDVSHMVDVIADFGNTRLPPGAIMHLPQIAKSPPYTHPNGGNVVIVASPGFMQEVATIYMKVYGQSAKLSTVATVVEARALLLEKRTAANAEVATDAPQRNGHALE